MPNKTLIDYVQDILSALDSDEVNSITDTVESVQVSRIVKRTYDSIVSRADLLEHYTLFQLTPSNSSLKPCVMHRPSDIDSILWIKYDKRNSTSTNQNFQDVFFMPLDQFIAMTNNLDETEDFVSIQTVPTTGSEVTYFKYRNDVAPTYYTSFDDYTLIFDSYDNLQDTTLQEEKTQCYGKKDQSWEDDDDFVPFIDPEFCTLLLNESLAIAFAELKQIPNDLATKWAMRQWTKTSHAKRGVDQNRRPMDDLPNYGRK